MAVKVGNTSEPLMFDSVYSHMKKKYSSHSNYHLKKSLFKQRMSVTWFMEDKREWIDLIRELGEPQWLAQIPDECLCGFTVS